MKPIILGLMFIVFAGKASAQTNSLSASGVEQDRAQVRADEQLWLPGLALPFWDQGQLMSSYSSLSEEPLNLKVEVPSAVVVHHPQAYAALENDLWRNPFPAAYRLNSAAAYRISDKISLMGSNFSANSVFSLHPFETSPEKMTIQGINFQLEYKVSDKLRIGGGVQFYQQSREF
ncbi:hypothetical protein [Mangrovibacterium marinum]|uniref:hypothetical protein n=1 Tax=Mangrovibacterium marinum TaxID=1639118 RepID=UPI0011B29E46|nr:hypothetical protein [Mangrovibacterium marinum]